MKESYLYRFVRPLITGFTKVFLRPKIEGLENIPKEGRIILAGTHTHILDCLLLMSSTKRCIHFLAKKELWKGSKKLIFAHMGLIPVDRKRKDHQAIELGEAVLLNEKVIGIFPEGTTEKEKGVLLPFKMGAVKMARDTNTNIIPFAISGKYQLFSNTLTIRFGKALPIDTDDLKQENNQLIEAVQSLRKGE